MQIVIDTEKDSKENIKKITNFLHELIQDNGNETKVIEKDIKNSKDSFEITGLNSIFGAETSENTGTIQNPQNNNKFIPMKNDIISDKNIITTTELVNKNEPEEDMPKIFIEPVTDRDKIQTLKEAIDDENDETKYKGIHVIPYD